VASRLPIPASSRQHSLPQSPRCRAASDGFTEIKFDGYRVQVHIKDAAVTVFTRRGNDWTKRFKKIADDAWHISAGSAIIDGEVVAPAADGTTDFSVLQNELKGRSTKIVMVAFDLLYLNGHDLRKLALIDRKALLKKLIADTDIQFSESFEVNSGEMFKHACKTGLEGVVSKVRDSKYASGRINDWVKKTCDTIYGRPRPRPDWTPMISSGHTKALPGGEECIAYRGEFHQLANAIYESARTGTPLVNDVPGLPIFSDVASPVGDANALAGLLSMLCMRLPLPELRCCSRQI
jgi:hypothetical protein